jgi:hypothetical protein
VDLLPEPQHRTAGRRGLAQEHRYVALQPVAVDCLGASGCGGVTASASTVTSACVTCTTSNTRAAVAQMLSRPRLSCCLPHPRRFQREAR